MSMNSLAHEIYARFHAWLIPWESATRHPDDQPIDASSCEPTQLLNPPHIGRVLWEQPGDDLPNWELLTKPPG